MLPTSMEIHFECVILTITITITPSYISKRGNHIYVFIAYSAQRALPVRAFYGFCQGSTAGFLLLTMLFPCFRMPKLV